MEGGEGGEGVLSDEVMRGGLFLWCVLGVGRERGGGDIAMTAFSFSPGLVCFGFLIYYVFFVCFFTTRRMGADELCYCTVTALLHGVWAVGVGYRIRQVTSRRMDD